MKEFPKKNPEDLTKDDISQILGLENKLNKTVLFYKPKNELMPEICFMYYDEDGDQEKAFKNNRIKNLVICKFKNCNVLLVHPGGSINHKTRKRHHAPESTPQISKFLPKKTTQEDKSEITKILAEFCIESGSSFHFATSLSIRNLIIKANNLG
ncbi:unnamed protein product [Meloidogyne enterolobii]|uniref:Uncharacterized protein n=1 Tax=Meloidogyne enterolobii TaxID=390850 RepID=A0ACB1AB23_MELEN